jgi:hypothetical protein
MPAARAEVILVVDNGMLKSCALSSHDIWYKTRAKSIVTTTEGIK